MYYKGRELYKPQSKAAENMEILAVTGCDVGFDFWHDKGLVVLEISVLISVLEITVLEIV